MTATEGFASVDADDESLEAYLSDAAVPAILPALAYLTGRDDLLAAELRPNPLQMLEPDAGYGPERRAAVVDLALGALKEFRDGGSVAAPPPDASRLEELMVWLTGRDDIDDHIPLFEEELSLSGDLRSPEWNVEQVAPDTDLNVVIIGAGMSGLAAAHRLRQAGVEVTIVDKNTDVGGTWFENTYPGCRVDVPNHLYSYSFAPRADWPEHFSDQPVLLDYFRQCADDLDLRASIRFETEVVELTWSDDAGAWTLDLETPDGPESITARIVVSATGQLNRPRYPDIDGLDSFAGPSFHSARWDHGADLRGKRVATIGTGASGAQFIPAIADDAGRLTVFQRTPPWLIPTPDYTDPLPEGLRWLFAHVPGYAEWYRLWLFWRYYEGMLPAMFVDPDWDNDGRSISPLNEMVRILMAEYVDEQFADHPDLRDAVMPTYPPGAKRMIRDDGAWARTLTADHVDLVTDQIDRITPAGVVTVDADGVETEHEVDVIVYGTGFTASEFLMPMQVTGRDGADLHETWDGEARAYLGITLPEFPNLFLMYGPNTNIVINGSIIYFSECEAHYIVQAARLLLEGDHRSMAPRPDVHDAYAERVDEANRQMAWGAADVNTWYKSETGRVTQNWPFSLLEFWQQTRSVDPDDYLLR